MLTEAALAGDAPTVSARSLLGWVQRTGQQGTGGRQIRADQLVAGVGRRDPYGAIETVSRMRKGIEGVRVEASAGLGRRKPSNRWLRCVRVVVQEDDSPK